MRPELLEIKEECQAILNSLFVQVKNDIEKLTSADNLVTPQGAVDIEVLEDYVYHVNSFYYRTFDQKMMPAYLEKVNRVVAEVYRVGRNAEQVRNDIASNLARCAGMYNLLKQFTRTLSEAEQVIEKDLKVLAERHRGISGQVREIIGDLIFEITSVERLFNDLETVGEARGWSQLVEGDIQLLQAVCLWEQAWSEGANARLRDELGRWLVSAEYLIEGLEEAARSFRETGMCGDWPALEARALQVGLASGFSTALAALVRETLGRWMEFEMEKAAFYERQGMSDRAGEHRGGFAAEAARRLERWVRVFRGLLRLSREGIDGQILSEISTLAPVAGEYAGAMARLLREFQRELQAFSDKLERWPDMGPFELEKSLEEAFCRYEKEMRRRWAGSGLPGFSRIGYRIRCALEYLELVGVKLAYHRERLAANLEQQERYRSLLEELRRHRRLFSGFRQDLENLMSPGTLKKVWKDITVEVKRYPANAGEQLPPECLPLLDKGYAVLKPDPKTEHPVVLEEKGDVFWIKVDGVERWEVPYLVVRVRG